MTEETFNKKLKKVNEVESKIKKLQESMLDTDMEIVKYLSENFETKEEFNEWLEQNKIPGFIHLLMLNHYT